MKTERFEAKVLPVFISDSHNAKNLVKYILITLSLLGVIPCVALAQSCQTANTMPDNQKRLGGGSSTGEYPGTTRIRGGQAVYVRIKNENVLGVSYHLTIEEDTSPPNPNCSYKAVLLPKNSVILSGTLFANPPIGWKITVEVGEESDTGVLTYEVYSQRSSESQRRPK